ncbi:hypothetical protein MRB53_014006 [Persea americana]|uniref:Uncharacterized protein n=1 Tax=Persea americana TaxID=3435 RepID=A0ACC2K9N1_PERAE|nr:hypothetical protein MRB53_014006 [Persea americana]
MLILFLISSCNACMCCANDSADADGLGNDDMGIRSTGILGLYPNTASNGFIPMDLLTELLKNILKFMQDLLQLTWDLNSLLFRDFLSHQDKHGKFSYLSILENLLEISLKF